MDADISTAQGPSTKRPRHCNSSRYVVLASTVGDDVDVKSACSFVHKCTDVDMEAGEVTGMCLETCTGEASVMVEFRDASAAQSCLRATAAAASKGYAMIPLELDLAEMVLARQAALGKAAARQAGVHKPEAETVAAADTTAAAAAAVSAEKIVAECQEASASRAVLRELRRQREWQEQVALLNIIAAERAAAAETVGAEQVAAEKAAAEKAAENVEKAAIQKASKKKSYAACSSKGMSQPHVLDGLSDPLGLFDKPKAPRNCLQLFSPQHGSSSCASDSLQAISRSRPSPASSPPPLRRLLSCASPECKFLRNDDEKFGGFCCRKCHLQYENKTPRKSRRSSSEHHHGKLCQRRVAHPGTTRAKDIPPQPSLG